MQADWKENIPPNLGDCRKIVTLEQDGMIWIGIRAWDGAGWSNNGQRETAKVLAWDDLPRPAYSDGLMGQIVPPGEGLDSDWH